MLHKFFQKQKEALDHFYAHLDMAHAARIFEEIAACQGVLFFTGVGKSGYVAQKVASTMLSTGTKAAYLPPIDALHGDLGMVFPQDHLIIFSKSGETDELLDILPFVRNKSAKIIAITSTPQSRLSRAADHSIELPCLAELCPFDLAPTTSTEIQLLFGDVLAMALMEKNGFNIESFAANHPGGRIGKRVQVKVKDLMLTGEKTPVCMPHHRLEEVLVDFTNKRCGCLLIIDENRKLKGIFTDGDLRRALQAKGEKVLKEALENIMTRTPKAIPQEALAFEALKLMESEKKHPVMVLPVVEGENQVIGLIKMHDIIQAGI